MARILLEAAGLKLNFGLRCVLDIEELRIYDGDRIGLIGENGAGKSTLLDVLTGTRKPDEGRVNCACAPAVIRQTGGTEQEGDGRLRSAFGAQEQREGLSGGELTRRRIAAALSQNSRLLMADEPTTDLDVDGVERLRKELERCEGAMVLVSHDRSLLDALCTRIWHLEDGHIEEFPGNYSAYRQELERRRAFQRFEYDQYRDEQARLRAAIQGTRERASQMKKAPSRMGNSEARLCKMERRQRVGELHKAQKQMEARLNQLEVKQRPREDVSIRMELGSGRPVPSRTAVEIRRLTLKAGERKLLTNAAFTLPTGSRTALTGPNGCGKTTLLRTVAARAMHAHQLCGGDFSGMPADPGSAVRIHPEVRIGWFDQTHERTLDGEKTALENVMRESMHCESDARTVLARLNLRGDDVFKPVRVLSGGERGRVALAKLLLSDANLLLLDEPTNHLDVFSLEALQEMLLGYRGTLLFVSHDRAFCETVATRSVRFDGGRLSVFEGTFAEFRERETLDRDREALELEISVLQMRMATLAGRMAAPKKGDNPETLNAEYLVLGEQVRSLKERMN